MEKKGSVEDMHKVILQIISRNPEITDNTLREKVREVSSVSEQERVYYLRSLSNQGYLRIDSNEHGEIFYSYQDPAKTMQLKKLEHEEMQIYKLIERSGSLGLGKADIKNKLAIANQIVNSAIRKLEKLALVKAYKPKNKTRNMYILFENEPDSDVIGGAFYANGKLDQVFIEELAGKIEQFVILSGQPSKMDIHNYLANLDGNGSSIKESDVDALINILILDDRIEDVSTIGAPRYGVSRNKDAFDTHVISGLPCLTCPVARECHTGFKISPENCIYFEDW